MKQQRIIGIGASILLLNMLFFSAVGALNTSLDQSDILVESYTLTKTYLVPEIREKDSTTIHMSEIKTCLSIAGKPILPYDTQILEFPLGSTIKKIACSVSKTQKIQLNKDVAFFPTPQPYTQNTFLENKEDVYPNKWFDYTKGGGLNRENQLVTFLKLQYYPVQYTHNDKCIEYANEISLEITIEKPTNSIVQADEYDLLIITPNQYVRLLNPLVEHKNNHNIQTKMVTLDDITSSEYFPVEGRDIQEQMKYFIKSAIENWGIIYVLLVGNYKKMPVRYSHLETDTGGDYEELEYLSDLYYADIYDDNGSFSSWDTDNDGIYGEWPYPDASPMTDDRDLYADVYVGRLACMYRWEVKTMVDKIIDYEENAYESDWFENMIVVGGDTFDKAWEDGADFDEGIEANKKALEYMDGFNAVKIWTTLDNLKTQTISKEMEKGAGFVYFVGHGNPRKWATHYNGDYQNWTEDFMNRDMVQLKNKGMYPICMVGGCHNSEFDVTPFNLLKDFRKSYIFSTYVPECWSWVFVKVRNGGCIASMGSTGYGGVNIGDSNDNEIPDCVEGLDGWFETQFFRLYNKENITMLGETYYQTVSDYIDEFPVKSYRYDCKIIETHVLFGDPSLKIGGYKK